MPRQHAAYNNAICGDVGFLIELAILPRAAFGYPALEAFNGIRLLLYVPHLERLRATPRSTASF